MEQPNCIIFCPNFLLSFCFSFFCLFLFLFCQSDTTKSILLIESFSYLSYLFRWQWNVWISLRFWVHFKCILWIFGYSLSQKGRFFETCSNEAASGESCCWYNWLARCVNSTLSTFFFANSKAKWSWEFQQKYRSIALAIFFVVCNI